jgi:hypothetical protein
MTRSGFDLLRLAFGVDEAVPGEPVGDLVEVADALRPVLRSARWPGPAMIPVVRDTPALHAAWTREDHGKSAFHRRSGT